MKGAGIDVASGESEMITHVGACGVERGCKTGPLDRPSPIVSADDAYGSGGRGAAEAELPDMGDDL